MVCKHAQLSFSTKTCNSADTSAVGLVAADPCGYELCCPVLRQQCRLWVRRCLPEPTDFSVWTTYQKKPIQSHSPVIEIGKKKRKGQNCHCLCVVVGGVGVVAVAVAVVVVVHCTYCTGFRQGFSTPTLLTRRVRSSQVVATMPSSSAWAWRANARPWNDHNLSQLVVCFRNFTMFEPFLKSPTRDYWKYPRGYLRMFMDMKMGQTLSAWEPSKFTGPIFWCYGSFNFARHFLVDPMDFYILSWIILCQSFLRDSSSKQFFTLLGGHQLESHIRSPVWWPCERCEQHLSKPVFGAWWCLPSAENHGDVSSKMISTATVKVFSWATRKFGEHLYVGLKMGCPQFWSMIIVYHRLSKGKNCRLGSLFRRSKRSQLCQAMIASGTYSCEAGYWLMSYCSMMFRYKNGGPYSSKHYMCVLAGVCKN